MHDSEKSDSAIVAVKPPNKAGLPVAEAVEPRAGAKGNADQQSTHRTQSRKRVTQALSRVRHAASPSNTQGRSRMLELGSSGAVRGMSSNGHPYRDPGSRSEGLEACKRVCLVPETGCEPTIRTRRSLASNLMLGRSATTPQDYPQ